MEIERQPFDKLLFIDIHNDYVLNTLSQLLAKRRKEKYENKIDWLALIDLARIRKKYESKKGSILPVVKDKQYEIFVSSELAELDNLINVLKYHSICNDPHYCKRDSTKHGALDSCDGHTLYTERDGGHYRHYDINEMIRIYEKSRYYLSGGYLENAYGLLHDARANNEALQHKIWIAESGLLKKKREMKLL